MCPISYNWDFGDGFSTYLTNPSHIYTDSGTYTVVLTGTSLTNDCPALDSVTLLVLPYPEVTATSSAGNGCIPLTIDFNSTVNSIGYYSWDFGDGNSSTLTNPTHTYTTDSNYNVFVRFEDFSGCVDSFELNILAYPIPQLGFTIDMLDTCVLPANYSFVNSTTGGVSYVWDFGDGNYSIQTNPSHTYLNDGNYTIQLDVSNSYGCMDSMSTVLSVNPITNAAFSVIQHDTCQLPASFSLLNSSTGSLTYNWDFGDGSTSNMLDPDYFYTSPGTYTINLSTMNNYGCSDTANTNVIVHPVPQADYSYIKYDSCILPSSYGFTNNSNGASSYLWNFSTLSSSLQTDPTFIFYNDGIYDVELIAFNNEGCTDTIIHYINVHPIPEASFNLVSSVGCEPFSSIFINNSQNSNFYNWDFGDGNTGSFLNGFHEYVSFGTYTIKLVVEDLEGCLDSTYQSVTVYPSPIADYSYTASDPCYLPIIVDFVNNSLGANSFQWNFDNGLLSTQTHPSTVYDTIGIYNLQLVVSNSYNCYDTLNEPFNVFFNQVPNAQFVFDDTVCLRDTSFFNSTSLYADSMVWDLGNGVNRIGDSANFVYDSAGQYSITLYAFNTGSGCSDTAYGTSTMVVLPTPVADYYFNHYYGSEPLGGVLEFFNTSTDADSYNWDLGSGDYSTEMNPTYNYLYNADGNHIYTLYAYNNNGCLDSISKELYLEYRKALYVPNAMYPEHRNFEVAHFIPKGTGLKSYHIEVFDTFGNVIWESFDIDDEGKPTGHWDGTFQGLMVEEDVYVWKVEATFKDDSSWEGKEYKMKIL